MAKARVVYVNLAFIAVVFIEGLKPKMLYNQTIYTAKWVQKTKGYYVPLM